MKPLVSVVMPVYNKMYTIMQSFQSILDQSVSEWELLAIDDCSTDISRKMLTMLRDKRLKNIFMAKNFGVVKAYYEGIRRARGKYVMFHDSDDMSLPNRMERCLQAIGDNDVVYHGMYIYARHAQMPIIARKYKPAEPWEPNRIFTEQYIPGVIFARTDLMRKILVPPEAAGAWDWMNHILLHQAKAKYVSLDEGLYDYVRSPNTSLSYHNEETGKRQASVKWIQKYLLKNKLVKRGHKFGRGFLGIETIGKKS